MRSAAFRTWLSVWSAAGYTAAGLAVAVGAFVIAQSRQFQWEMLTPVVAGVLGVVAVGFVTSAGKMAAGAADDLGSVAQFFHEQRQAARRQAEERNRKG